MFRILLYVALTALYALLLALPVEWLWNHFVPGCLHLRPIGFVEAMGLVAVGRLFHALRLLGFLFHTAFWSVAGGWVLQWAWNRWLVPGFGLGAITWLQAGGLVALLHLVAGSGHALFRWRHPMGHALFHTFIGTLWGTHRRFHEEMRERRRQERRRCKEEWKAWKEDMKGWSQDWKREGRNWKDWADDAAPLGSHRHWRHFDRFWKECGKARFEAWLREKGITED